MTFYVIQVMACYYFLSYAMPCQNMSFLIMSMSFYVGHDISCNSINFGHGYVMSFFVTHAMPCQSWSCLPFYGSHVIMSLHFI